MLITEKSQSLKEQIALRAQEKPSTTLGTKGGTILSKNRNSQLSRIPSLSQVNEATKNQSSKVALKTLSKHTPSIADIIPQKSIKNASPRNRRKSDALSTLTFDDLMKMHQPNVQKPSGIGKGKVTTISDEFRPEDFLDLHSESEKEDNEPDFLSAYQKQQKAGGAPL